MRIPQIALAALLLVLAVSPSRAATFEVTYALDPGGIFDDLAGGTSTITGGSIKIRYEGLGPRTVASGAPATLVSLHVLATGNEFLLLSPVPANKGGVHTTGYFLPQGFVPMLTGPSLSRSLSAVVDQTIGNILDTQLAFLSLGLFASLPVNSTTSFSTRGWISGTGQEILRVQAVPEPTGTLPAAAATALAALVLATGARRARDRRADRRRAAR